jgi:tellurite resistance protein
MRGAGTDEATIHEVLSGRTLQEVKQIRNAYQERYGRDLDTDLRSELSGDDLKQAQAAMRGESSAKEAEAGTQHKSSPLDDAKRLFKAMDGLGTNEAEIHLLLKGRTKEDINAIRNAYQANYERNLDADIHSELSGRDLFDAKMNLRGRAETAEDKLARMNERYEYERGEGNAVGRLVMDRLSDKRALLDSNHQRANAYYQQAMSDGQLDQNERARLISDLTSYANDDVGSYQNAKESAADTAGTVAATAASAAVIVGTGGHSNPVRRDRTDGHRGRRNSPDSHERIDRRQVLWY